MYTSGQFVHYLALREDWRDENLPTSNRKNVLGIIMTLYSVTEIFLFISNLARNGLYDNRVNLILELHGILGKILVFHEQPHEILRELYNTYESKNLSIKIEKDFSKNEVISSSALLAMKTVAEIFERFNWSASEDIFCEMTKKNSSEVSCSRSIDNT